MKDKRKRGRPKKTWKVEVEESKSVALEKEDALKRVGWRVGELERLLLEWGKSSHPHLRG